MRERLSEELEPLIETSRIRNAYRRILVHDVVADSTRSGKGATLAERTWHGPSFRKAVDVNCAERRGRQDSPWRRWRNAICRGSHAIEVAAGFVQPREDAVVDSGVVIIVVVAVIVMPIGLPGRQFTEEFVWVGLLAVFVGFFEMMLIK